MDDRQAVRNWRRGLVVTLVGLLWLWAPWGVQADSHAVLVMFDQDDCPYCDRWRAEIGGAYPKTPEGALAPLRQIDLHAPLPADLPGLRPASFSPVFVLWQNGREIGRIQGYPGADFFWPMLGELLAKLDPPA